MTAQNPPRLLNVQDVAEMLGICKEYVYDLFSEGEAGVGIRSFKLRGQWRCTQKAYDEFIARCEDTGGWETVRGSKYTGLRLLERMEVTQ